MAKHSKPVWPARMLSLVIEIFPKTAEKTADGRRNLIDSKKTNATGACDARRRLFGCEGCSPNVQGAALDLDFIRCASRADRDVVSGPVDRTRLGAMRKGLRSTRRPGLRLASWRSRRRATAAGAGTGRRHQAARSASVRPPRGLRRSAAAALRDGPSRGSGMASGASWKGHGGSRGRRVTRGMPLARRAAPVARRVTASRMGRMRRLQPRRASRYAHSRSRRPTTSRTAASNSSIGACRVRSSREEDIWRYTAPK